MSRIRMQINKINNNVINIYIYILLTTSSTGINQLLKNFLGANFSEDLLNEDVKVVFFCSFETYASLGDMD